MAESEMLDRATAAVIAQIRKNYDEGGAWIRLDPTDDQIEVDGYISAKDIARAVVEAMREPTEVMCEAGLFAEDNGEISVGPIWRAMIDEAQK